MAFFLKEYSIIFEMLKFKENSFQIIGFEKEDKHKAIIYDYDFILYLERKYQYPKITAYKIIGILEQEDYFERLHNKIDKLKENVENLEFEIDECESLYKKK